MQGYLTMAYEIVHQIKEVPTHLFLQAGVGAMAGAISAFFRQVYGKSLKIIIVEANQADCLYQTFKANDGLIHKVDGDLNTIMAGLACGEPCSIGYELLSYTANVLMSISDEECKKAICELGNMEHFISGESGAAGYAGFLCVKQNVQLCEKLELNEKSVVLCISTEGATDLMSYQNIMEGK